jgi:preprotein translocase subunit Sss1
MPRRPTRTELAMVVALALCTIAQIGLTVLDLLSA